MQPLPHRHRPHQNVPRCKQTQSFLPCVQGSRRAVQTLIVSESGAPNHNPSAENDIPHYFAYLSADLEQPQNCAIILTDAPNAAIPDGLRATIRILQPTRTNVQFAHIFATSRLRPDDECSIWFGCHGKPGGVLLLSDPTDEVFGSEIRQWITEYTDHRVLLRIALDACHAGRGLLGLPFYFDSGGELILADVTQLEDAKIASIICLSACRDDELAHTVEKKDKSHLGGLLWFLLRHLKGQGGSCLARDIQARLSPSLSSPKQWTQTPVVSMSRYDPNATFSM